MAEYTGDPRQAPAGTVVQTWGTLGPIIAEGNGKFYAIENGKKRYVPPFVVMQGYHPGTEVGPDGQLTAQAIMERTAQNVPGASLFKTRGEFDPSTGDFKQGINWNNIISMVVGGVITAGMADAIMGASAGTTEAAVASGQIPTEAVATGAATGAEAAGVPVAGLSTAVPTGAAATGAATGAEAAGVPTGASTGTTAATTATDATSSLPGAGLPGSEGYAPGNTFANGIPSDTPSYLSTLKDIGNTATDVLKGRADARAQEAGLTNNANNSAINLYRAQVDANNAQNTYGLNQSNAENNFGTTAYGLDLSTANSANNFALGRGNLGLGIGQLDLAQKNYALEAPGKRAGNAVRGDILANAQDASISTPSTIPKFGLSGGLRPSMFSANTRALGGEMSAQALAQQRAGDTFAPLPTLPDYQGPKTALPTYKAPPPYVNPPPAPTMTPQPQSNGVDTALGIAGYAGLAAPYLKYLKYL